MHSGFRDIIRLDAAAVTSLAAPLVAASGMIMIMFVEGSVHWVSKILRILETKKIPTQLHRTVKTLAHMPLCRVFSGKITRLFAPFAKARSSFKFKNPPAMLSAFVNERPDRRTPTLAALAHQASRVCSHYASATRWAHRGVQNEVVVDVVSRT